MAELKIKADSGGGTVSLKGPATTTSNAAVQLTLPVDDGTANQYLKTDGSGALSWATVDTSIADDSITEAKLDIHAAPSGTDKFLGYTSNGMEWAAVPAGGITYAAQWRVTSAFSGSSDAYVTSNWELIDQTGQGNLLTTSFSAPSSGVFTLPATGYWLIKWNVVYGGDQTDYVAGGIFWVNQDESTYYELAEGWGQVHDDSGTVYGSFECSTIFDCPNVAENKVAFNVGAQNNTTYFGNGSKNMTYATFIRLGDT